MTTPAGHDWPLSLPAAHGRISAYRAALAQAEDALVQARPFVQSAAYNLPLSDPRQPAAGEALVLLDKARATATAELAVTSP